MNPSKFQYTAENLIENIYARPGNPILSLIKSIIIIIRKWLVSSHSKLSFMPTQKPKQPVSADPLVRKFIHANFPKPC